MAGGQTKFGIPVQNWAQSPFAQSDAGPEGDLAPAIWEGMGNLGQAIANYNPSGYDRPVEAPPGPSTRPEDNPVQALPPAGTEVAAGQQAMIPEDRLAAAKYKEAHHLPLDMGDLMALDDENVRLHPGGKNASTTTSSFSRQVAPTGAAWEENQAALGAEQDYRDEIRRGQTRNLHDLSMMQGEHAMQSARMADAQANELTQLGAQQQKADAEYKAKLDRTMADQEKANTAYQKAAAGYDPDRLMRGGNQVIASLALAMGAFGSSLTHAPNYALEIINNAINRDIDRQKTGIAAKKEQITWLDHVMAGNRARFSDENAARLMTRANAKDVYATRMEGMAAKIGGVERMAATRDQAYQVKMSGAQDREHGLRLQEAADRAQAGQRTTQTTTSQADTIVRPGDLIRNAKTAAETQKLMGEVAGGPKLNPSEQKQVVDTDKAMSALADSITDVKRYQDLNEKTYPVTRGLSLGDDAKSQRTVATSLERNLAMAQNKGTLSQPDVDAAHDELNQGAWTAHGLNVKANELARSAGSKIAHEIMSLPPAARAERIQRFVGMVGEETAMGLLQGAGLRSSAEVGAAGGGR